MALKRDDNGHLADPGAWSEEVARTLAEEAGIVLDEDHWRIIDIVRRFHAQTGVSPSMRPLVKLARQQAGADLGSSIALLRLFPGSPAALAAKVAGLPRPDQCL